MVFLLQITIDLRLLQLQLQLVRDKFKLKRCSLFCTTKEMERQSLRVSLNPSRWGRPTTAAERQTFTLFCRKQFIKRIEELAKNREEATKKYKEEMAGYCISSMEEDIHTICRSHDLPHANGNKHPLVFTIPDLCSPDRSILDISTKDFHTISSPHFRDALCLYNKGEWLLMCHKEVPSEKHQNSLFLLNPASGTRIDLPRQYEEGYFAFSITCGKPCHVIHAIWKSPYGVVIQKISPGDSSWKVYELGHSHQDIAISATLVIGNLVLCIDHEGGRIITFDLSECSWDFLPKRKKFPNNSKCFFIEQDNDVMCVSCPTLTCDFFRFYKLDWQRMDWVELNNIELMNTSWFLGHPCSFYMKGGKGKFVYSLKSFENWGGQPGECAPSGPRGYPDFQIAGKDILMYIFIHNLVEGCFETLPPYQSKKPACWVDGRLYEAC